MTHPDFRRKLEAMGFGFFIPVFFVSSGVRFDLAALTASATSLLMVPIFLAALVAARGLPAALYRGRLGTRKAAIAGLMQATSLPFIVAATAIGQELRLIDAAGSAALIGAGLLSVLLFPAAGLALLRRHAQPKGSAMQTTCSSYATTPEADAAVQQLLADGMPGTRISVISGRMTEDHRADHVGAYAGDAVTVGAYAGATGSTADAMGSFASGAGEQRRGSVGDIDRDEITTYESGVRRVHIASHHELSKRLSEAGLDAGSVAVDVAAVHAGRVLVLVTAA
jgi:hypothetical protein